MLVKQRPEIVTLAFVGFTEQHRDLSTLSFGAQAQAFHESQRAAPLRRTSASPAGQADGGPGGGKANQLV